MKRLLICFFLLMFVASAGLMAQDEQSEEQAVAPRIKWTDLFKGSFNDAPLAIQVSYVNKN